MKLLQGVFYFFLFVIIWLYWIFGVLAVVWSILGAIMNPAKFLPYAAAAVTLMVFIRAKYNNIQAFQDQIYKKLDEVIQKKFMAKLEKTLEKVQNKA